MSLSQKITLIIILQLLLLATAESLVQYKVILPIFENLEQRQAEISIQQIEERFEEDLDDLDRVLYDWSAWDDTYDFIENENQRFIDSNLGYTTFTNSNVNLVLFVKGKDQLLWGMKLDYDPDLDDFAVEDFSDNLKIYLPYFEPHIKSIDLDEGSSDDQFKVGYQQVKDHLYMFSVRPIYDSDGETNSNGFLIMARLIDTYLHYEYQDQLKIAFDLDFNWKNTHEDTFNQREYSIIPIDEENLRISKYFLHDNKPVIKISTQIPRDITKNGLKSIYTAIMSLFLIGLISLLSIWLFLKHIAISPIHRLKTQMSLIAKTGNYEHRSKLSSNDEIGELSNTFNNMLDIIEKDKQVLEENNKKLVQQKEDLEKVQAELTLANRALTRVAKTDALTKLSNRLTLEEKLENDWHTLARLKQPLSFLLMDIDFFKQFNDNYGHQAGDECLKQVALIILSCIRRSCDLVARYGGEEFAVVLPGVDSKESTLLAERILSTIRTANIEHKYSKIEDFVSLSIGINTMTPTADGNVSALIEGADQALYKCKEMGRNQAQIYFGSSS